MKLEVKGIPHVAGGETLVFSGEIPPEDFAKLKFTKKEQGLLRFVTSSASTNADWLQALEMIFRRHQDVVSAREAHDAYKADHAKCPECPALKAAMDITKFGVPPGGPDMNRVKCKCGWRGTVHELVAA